MTTATVNVNVTLTAAGSSPAQGVTFAYAAGAGTPPGVVTSTDGSLDFTKAFTKGTAIALVFNLQTSSLMYGSSAYPVSIYAQGGAANALWIGQAKPLKGPYSGTEFNFPPNPLGPGNASLSIVDSNDDGLTWYYELWVYVGGTVATKFGHDPHIINHSNNK